MTGGYRGRDLVVRLGGRTVLEVEALRLEAGEFTAVAGPNGAGKSTLLGVLAGQRRDYSGTWELGGRPPGSWGRGEWARAVSYLPQRVEIPFPFTSRQVVMMGRAVHAGSLFDSPEDEAMTSRALKMAGAEELAGWDFRTLSGGERQRVLVAAALAQSTGVLLLDEPAASLDLKHQVSLYGMLRGLASEGSLVVAATHNLGMAARYAHRIVLLHGGKIAADGAPGEVLTKEVIERVFEVDLVTAGLGGR